MSFLLFPERIQALWRQAAAAGCDAVWIIRPENRRYLAGFTAEDHQFTELSASLLIGREKHLLITDSRYTLAAQAEAPGFEVVTTTRGLAEELPQILAGHGFSAVGFEAEYLTWGLHDDLNATLGRLNTPTRLVPLKNTVEALRLLKDQQEAEHLAASAAMISAILDEVIRDLAPGRTEKAVAWQVENLAREAGADGLAFPSIVASGPNSALPHAVPGERRLQAGEPITLDVGVRLAGYCSDITRTVFLGEPADRFKKIYRTVREAQRAALEVIRPGLMSDAADRAARDVIAAAGYGACFGHALGHGVGLATHEAPRLSPLKPLELKAGMVVTVEPGIYIAGAGGVRLEETILITPGGVRILTIAGALYEF